MPGEPGDSNATVRERGLGVDRDAPVGPAYIRGRWLHHTHAQHARRLIKMVCVARGRAHRADAAHPREVLGATHIVLFLAPVRRVGRDTHPADRARVGDREHEQRVVRNLDS